MATVGFPPPDVDMAEYWRLRGTQRRPRSGVEARIVDDLGAVLPEDGVVVGELEVRGGWITPSYFRDTGSSKFRRGWLRTGEVGRIDRRGYVTLTDRVKDVIMACSQ
jgi:fatty-acyl-CoA synthase